MSLKFSLNIFLFLVRAMYSLRVKSEDYKKIVAYKSVRDVLKFLKENRFYGSALERVTENSEDVDLLSVERLLNYKFLDILELISKSFSSANVFVVSKVEKDCIPNSDSSRGLIFK